MPATAADSRISGAFRSDHANAREKDFSHKVTKKDLPETEEGRAASLMEFVIRYKELEATVQGLPATGATQQQVKQQALVALANGEFDKVEQLMTPVPALPSSFKFSSAP